MLISLQLSSNQTIKQKYILLDKLQYQLRQNLMNISASEDTTKVKKYLSEAQLKCIETIITNLSVCSSDIEQFILYLQKVSPLLHKDCITMKRMSLASSNIIKNAQYIACSLKLLEDQLKNSAFELPELEQADAFVQLICSYPDRQTLFFQIVEHFFHPNSPYLKNKTKRVETRLQDSQLDILLTFQQINDMLNYSKNQIAYILSRMQLLSQIFHLLLQSFNIDHKIILFQIRKSFKINQYESINLQNFTKAIHNSANTFRTYAQKISQKINKPATQKQVTRPPTQKKCELKQPKNQPYLTFKSKAINYLQALFRPQPALQQHKLKNDQQQQLLSYPKQQ